MTKVFEGKKGKTVRIVLIVAAAVILAGAGAYAASTAAYHKGLETAEMKNYVESEVAQYNDEVNGEEAVQDAKAKESIANEAVKTKTASSDIGLEKAKTIALDQVKGATAADIIKAQKDYDDGRLEYDIEIRYDGYEYEFELDGASGQIIGSEVDRADWF